MRVARVLGAMGRVLIWAGAIVLLFVAYQLWGTGLAEARAQNDLEDDFAALLETRDADLTTETSTTSTSTPRSTTTSTTSTTTAAPPPPPDDGEAVARIVIPKIGVDKIVVEGVSRGDLQKGPGHYPTTPLPGQPGNAAIAGHRTTYGAPFHRVDELDPGDEILVTTLQGTFRYEVMGQEIVDPTRVDVVEDQGDDRLTLTSCHPKYSAAQRIIISALLVDDPAPAPEPQVELVDDVTEDPSDGDGGDAGDPGDDPEDDPVLAAPDPPVDEAGLVNLDGDERGSLLPVILFSSITALIWLGFYALSRTWRRIPSYVLGAPVFLVSLFVTFGAVTELLPANF